MIYDFIFVLATHFVCRLNTPAPLGERTRRVARASLPLISIRFESLAACVSKSGKPRSTDAIWRHQGFPSHRFDIKIYFLCQTRKTMTFFFGRALASIVFKG